MSNMGYCAFENTVRDMQDCIDRIDDFDFDDASEYEVIAFKTFYDLCREVVDNYDEEDFEEK